jgi:hypothetical protein
MYSDQQNAGSTTPKLGPPPSAAFKKIATITEVIMLLR